MMTYEIDVERQVVRVGPTKVPGWFTPRDLDTWRQENFLRPTFWNCRDEEEKDAFRVARDELIERGLIPDE